MIRSAIRLIAATSMMIAAALMYTTSADAAAFGQSQCITYSDICDLYIPGEPNNNPCEFPVGGCPGMWPVMCVGSEWAQVYCEEERET